VRIRISELRRIIRQVLSESGLSASGVDPTKLDPNSNGFYPYELERGVDIQARWYKSPGATVGGDGDPGRPSDPEEYIGMKQKQATPEGETVDSTADVE